MSSTRLEVATEENAVATKALAGVVSLFDENLKQQIKDLILSNEKLATAQSEHTDKIKEWTMIMAFATIFLAIATSLLVVAAFRAG